MEKGQEMVEKQLGEGMSLINFLITLFCMYF